MTTEEIEKAAEEYQVKIYTDVYEEGSLAEQELQCINDFKAGGEFVNKHWQEKTRWIPVDERLPEVRETPYCIAIKYESVASKEEMIGALYVYDQSDVNYILLEDITHWKEIE